MSNETIADLRRHLFDALRGLTDKAKPMEVERARAVSDLAQTIINTAKVELDALRLAGKSESRFLSESPSEIGVEGVEQTTTGTKTVTVLPGCIVTQHRLR